MLLAEIHTEAFGTVMLVAVGATIVGSIHHLSEPGAFVKKGQEHGFFAFGGSTVLLLFQVRLDYGRLFYQCFPTWCVYMRSKGWRCRKRGARAT